MVNVIILSGGSGTRFGGSIPKQYLKVKNKLIIGYCLDTFQQAECISQIIVVADSMWQKQILEYIEQNNIFKFSGFANAGQSRQHSIKNGLIKIRELGGKDNDLVVIHDAARPNVSIDIINMCVSVLYEYDCSMPVISVKDTVYMSDDGKNITSLLDRDKLYAGQAPEGCHLGPYLSINEKMNDEDLSLVRGTSEIAYKNGLKVGLFTGSENNYKITTKEDYDKFVLEKG